MTSFLEFARTPCTYKNHMCLTILSHPLPENVRVLISLYLELTYINYFCCASALWVGYLVATRVVM